MTPGLFMLKKRQAARRRRKAAQDDPSKSVQPEEDMAETTPSKPLSPEFWVGLLSPLLVSGIAIVLAPLAILKAWVISMLWAWYIVPAFGAAPLRVVYAFGAAMLVSYLTHQHIEDARTFTAKVVGSIYFSLMVLLVGWIGTFFI